MPSNIFEQSELLKKVEDIKLDVMKKSKTTAYTFKRAVVKGIAVTGLIFSLMTAPGFGAEYTVNDVTGLLNYLNQDMIATERNTIINYDGSERWDTYSEAYSWVTSQFLSTEKNLPVPYSFNRIRVQQNHVVLQDTDGKYYVDKAVFTEYFKHTQADLVEIDARVADILIEIITAEMTDAQKVNAVYGFVIDTIHYQFQQSDGNIDGLIKERNVLGALRDGTGVVCDAYAFLA